MSFFKEIPTPRKPEQTEEEKKNDCQHEEKSEDSNRMLESESGNKSSSDLSEALNLVFKKFGLIEETADKKKSDTSESSEYKLFKYLEQGEDGKYYDKETGKAYVSIEAWIKVHKDLAERYKAEANYYERNGISAKAEELNKKAEKIEERLKAIGSAISYDVYRCEKKNFTFENQIPESFFKSSKFQELREIFQLDSWCKMDYNEKVQAIRELGNCLSKALNLQCSPKIDVCKFESYVYGYCYNNNVIEINALYLNNPQEMIKTVAHEIWHVYQRMKARYQKTYKDYLYCFNFNVENYIKGELSEKCYEKQLVEAEAFAFENYFISKFGDDFK